MKRRVSGHKGMKNNNMYIKESESLFSFAEIGPHLNFFVLLSTLGGKATDTALKVNKGATSGR